MNMKNHHDFTLWVYSEERDDEKVPALIFDEGTSFDEICLTMLALEKLHLDCCLSCDTWSEYSNSESEDVSND